ncbi:alpha/beta hydrolase [Mycolicibacterium sp. S2-37]|uniref:alpha/beta fold hydrolase n=1 Tax=Mycolicibacterium sp. S2-37 TaxID=2810297 RepID=UPI001A94104F|nr:alpha/beta hydrolase [Mycolicibacterium sp. S2-37]MBO0675913.1 alpha/beta hydrolase [Mycolicibacterium sp. S2-37]
MELFVTETGPVGRPPVMFLHGAERSGEYWQPVVEQLPQYRCLTADLPRHGKSPQRSPFSITAAACAVAEVIRHRGDTGRAHLVGHSLGAQVGVQLLATAPEVVDRAVLCGAFANPLPGVWLTRHLLGAVAAMTRSITISHTTQPDTRDLKPAGQISEIVVESAGFTCPDGLDRAGTPTLFLAGSRELAFVRQSGAALARQMPRGADGFVRGMGHNWPLHRADIFARTVDGWLSDEAMPSEIVLTSR